MSTLIMSETPFRLVIDASCLGRQMMSPLPTARDVVRHRCQPDREKCDALRVTLLPIVWQGRALKRMGKLAEAIDVLSEGLRVRGARDDGFRRAVALWNLACYQALMNVRIMTPEMTRSIVALLDEAIQNAPEFRESLTEQALDRDQGSLIGNPIFDQWRSVILDTKR